MFLGKSLGGELGKSLGISGGGFPAPFVVANRPRTLFIYDSISNQLRAQASATGGWNDQTKLYFDPVTAGGTQRMGQDGAFLLKSMATAASGSVFFIDDDAGADPAGWVRSARYSTNLAALTAGPETIDFVVFLSGVNDANPASGITKTLYKQGCIKLFEFLQEDLVNLQAAFIPPLHRFFGGTPSDANCQIVREAQIELVSESNKFYALPWIGDLDLTDAVHFTTTEYQTNIPERFVRSIAAACKKASYTGILGPRATAASFGISSLDLTIAPDDGDDITVPSGSEDAFGLEVDGTFYAPTSAERLSATSLRLYFEESGFQAADIDSLKVCYGAMKDMAQTSAPFVKDNSSLALPLQPAVLTPSLTNPRAATPFNLRLSAQLCDKTFSGDSVTNVLDLSGQNWLSASGFYPEYSAAAFDNLGALTAPDNYTALYNDTNITLQDWMKFEFVFYVPETIPENCTILSFGTSAGGQPTPRFSLTLINTGELRWQRNQGEGGENLISDCRGMRIALTGLFIDSTEAYFFVNSTTATTTFDPRDGMTSQNRVWLFAGDDDGGSTIVDKTCPDLQIAHFELRTAASEPVGEPSVASSMAFLMDYYNVPL